MPPKRKYTEKPVSSAKPLIDLTGHRYGRLTVLDFYGAVQSGTQRRMLWRVRCDCGREDIVLAALMRSGNTRSCHCLHSEATSARSTRHGATGTLEHNSYRGMIERCYDPMHISYQYYGARHITVCQRWRDSFTAFLEDMGPRPDASYSIDRIDNERGYEPDNCRWATRQQQARNRRLSRPRETQAPVGT